MSSSVANKIDANDRSLREILQFKKYSIDFFQREYKWKKRHVEQLLVDLEEAFLDNYKLGDSITSIGRYNSYYMGPVIFYDKSSTRSIIDGQQRLTSVTLILIYIHNIQKDLEEKEPIVDLIYSRKHGRTSFNLDVPERYNVLDTLFNGKIDDFNVDEEKNFSVVNTYERYLDVKELFPETLKKEKLPLFIDWLKEKLIFVEIIAYSDKNAYTIFETMNDRGYNLTPSEMLKGFLLSKIENEDFLREVNSIWREKISELHYFSIDEDLEFFRAWLRGRYAETMKRSSLAGTAREDFEKIGTSFHRWVKENAPKLKLKTEESFYFFIKGDFIFYSDLYKRIKILERTPEESLRNIHYISYYSIATSLSYPLYISSITKLDSEDVIDKKLSIIANYIERFILFRSLNKLPISQTTIRFSLFNNVIREIRNLDVKNLKLFLNSTLDYQASHGLLAQVRSYSLNKKFLRYFLAKITYHLNTICDISVDFYDLMTARRKTGCVQQYVIQFNDLLEHEEYSIEADAYSFLFSLTNQVLCRKDLIGDKNNLAHNIYYRMIVTDNLSEEERIILRTRYTLPSTFQISENWLLEREQLLLEICIDIWNKQSL